jgi:hypothetical protein
LGPEFFNTGMPLTFSSLPCATSSDAAPASHSTRKAS